MQSNSPVHHGHSASCHPTSSPMPPPLSPMLPLQSSTGHFAQMSPNGSLRSPISGQSSVCGQVSPVSSMVTTGTFRHPITQPISHIFTTVSPMALPLSPSIFQMAAGNLVSQTPIFAATQQGISQIQPVFLNGQQAAIINSVPGSPVGLVGTPATGTAVPGIFAATGPTTGIPGAAIPALQPSIHFMNHQQIQSVTPPRSANTALSGQDPDLPTDLTKKSNTPQLMDTDATSTSTSGSLSGANQEICHGLYVKKEDNNKNDEVDMVSSVTKQKELKDGERKGTKEKEDRTQDGYKYDNIDTNDYTAGKK